MRTTLFSLLLVLLHGCSSTAQAPVSSRGSLPEPEPTVSRPGGAVVTRPARPVSRPVGASQGQYQVRRGDTLYSVAWQHGLTIGELARQNRIDPPYTIFPGQRLQVSPPSRAVAPVRIQPLPDKQSTVAQQQTKPAAVQAQKPVATARPPVTGTTKPAATPPRAASTVPGFDGNWTWPTRGRVLRNFRENASGKKGIEIGGHHAQPVKAAASGKIVYSGSGLVGYGRLIIIKHNENLLSAYGHNSKLLVKDGDLVKAGETIARMGSSGTDRTALYFEIRKDGKPVNPMRYLPRN